LNDIPNVSEATKDLDENGMIRIGAEVKPGDILIGKITQKRIRSPEKMLRDAPSLHGVVLDKNCSQEVKDKRKRTQDKDALGA
jgi:DNA-directed RNA polymerase subunit beta